MRLVPSALVLAIALLSSSAPVDAQQPSFIVMPKGGFVVQARPFQQQHLLVSDFQRIWKYEMDAAATYGILIETPTPFKSLGVRLEASRAGRASIREVPGSTGPPTRDVSAKVNIASIAAVFQPERFCWGNVCPRLLGGGGVKSYDFEGNLLWDDIVDRFADDQSPLTLQLGAGIVAYVSRLAIIAEITDYSNGIRFASRDQPTNRVHDIAFNLGAGLSF